MKKIIWSILNSLKIGGMIQLQVKSYVKEVGWIGSFHEKLPIDANGKPIPWFSYPIIHFLEQKLNKNQTVFEYGSGNSTIWFASRVKKIVSVEHEKGWMDLVKPKLPQNAEVIFHSLEGNSYVESVKDKNEKYDVIIVDGRKRIESTKNAYDGLSENGVIIFDNSNVDEYKPAFEFLESKGFKRIDFTGMVPITPIYNTTTLFYRQNNCFNI